MEQHRVFVIQRTDHDLSQLSEWGTIKILFGRGFFPDDISERQEKMRLIMDRHLGDFKTDFDFVVPVGDLILVAVVTEYLVSNEKSPFRMLKFDKLHKGYYPIDIGDYSYADSRTSR